jgi:hypothetical protein
MLSWRGKRGDRNSNPLALLFKPASHIIYPILRDASPYTEVGVWISRLNLALPV